MGKTHVGNLKTKKGNSFLFPLLSYSYFFLRMAFAPTAAPAAISKLRPPSNGTPLGGGGGGGPPALPPTGGGGGLLCAYAPW
jgi:hypothetical protein